MHLHKNRLIKRAGVAGIALRAEGVNTVISDRLRASWRCLGGVGLDVDASFYIIAVLALLWALVRDTKKPPGGGCCGCLWLLVFR